MMCHFNHLTAGTEFSSPERFSVGYCERSLSVVGRPSTFCSKRHLFLNHLTNFDKTLERCSCGGPLSKLFKELNSMLNSNWMQRNVKTLKIFLSKSTGQSLFSLYVYIKNLKNLLVQKFWPDLINLGQMFLGWPSFKIVQIILILWKTWPPGGGDWFPFNLHTQNTVQFEPPLLLLTIFELAPSIKSSPVSVLILTYNSNVTQSC